MAPPEPSYKRACAALYCAVTFVYGLQASISGPTATLLADQAHVTPSDLWPTYTAGGICLTLGSLPCGWLMDRLPAHALLAASLLLQAAALACLPACRSVAALTAAFAVDSLSFNVVNAVTFTLTILLFTRSRGPWMNALSCLFAAGNLVVPLLVEACTQLLGPSLPGAPFFLVSGCTAAVALVTLCVPTPPEHAASMTHPLLRFQQQQPTGASEEGDREQRVPLLLEDGRSCDADAALMVDSATADAAGVRAAAGQPGTWIVWLPGCTLMFCHVSINVSVSSWIYTYALEYAGESPRHGLGCTTFVRARRHVSSADSFCAPPPFARANHPCFVFHRGCTTRCATTRCCPMHATSDPVLRGTSHLHPGLSSPTATLIDTCYWAALTAGRLLSIPTAAFLGPLQLLLLTMPLVIAGAALPLLWRGGGGASAEVLYVSAAAIGLGVSTGFANALSLMSKYIHVDGHVSGLVGVALGLGVSIVPSAVPWLSARLPMGFQVLMAAVLAAGAAQILAALAIEAAGRRRLAAADRRQRLLPPSMQSAGHGHIGGTAAAAVAFVPADGAVRQHNHPSSSAL